MFDLSTLNPGRILVCQQRQIGDVLLSTPVFELLKKRFPEAELHLFTEKKCEPLLRHNPFIDKFHLIDRKDGFFRQLAFYRNVASCGFDVVTPDGAFYLFVRSPEPSAAAFSERAKGYELLLVPGDGFGCEGYVRIAYCVSPQMIERSVPAFRALAASYGLL